MGFADWESRFRSKISEVTSSALSGESVAGSDPAHDLLHFERVVGLTRTLCEREGGNPDVALPAAWLHDLVIIPKDSPLRSQASRLSAERAIEFLCSIGYPKEFHDAIAH